MEKKHREWTDLEMQDLGAVLQYHTQGSASARGKMLLALKDADAAFAALQNAEADAARAPLGPELDRRGAMYRDEQLERDAELVGRYGGLSPHEQAKVPGLREAGERLRQAAAMRAAPAAVDEAKRRYEQALLNLASREKDAAEEARRLEVQQLQEELARAQQVARQRWDDPTAAARVRDIATKLQKLQS